MLYAIFYSILLIQHIPGLCNPPSTGPYSGQTDIGGVDLGGDHDGMMDGSAALNIATTLFTIITPLFFFFM